MDSLDFDDIASALSQIDSDYRIHFIGTFDEYDENEDGAGDICYATSASEFVITSSWIEAHEQSFEDMSLPRVVLEDVQGTLLSSPHSYAVSPDDYEALMGKFVALGSERVNSGW